MKTNCDDGSSFVSLSNLRSSAEFRILAEILRDINGQEEFDYYPSPGNWGDALINVGTEQFLKKNQFQYSEHHRRYALELAESSKAPSLHYAVVGGGGGWCKNWKSTSEFVGKLSHLYSHVVVLPTTFDRRVAELDLENVTYISRGLNVHASNTYFCHDMAFYLEHSIAKPNSNLMDYPLISLRRDKERNSGSFTPDRNWDISLLGNSFTPISSFFDIISRFRSIYTDRLHVAIAGSLVGAEVFLLEGNYEKNFGVFEASISNNYRSTNMISWGEFSKLNISGLVPVGKSGY